MKTVRQDFCNFTTLKLIFMKKLFCFFLLNFSFLIVTLSGIEAFSQNLNLNSAVSYYEDYTKYNELKSLPLAKEKIDLAAANRSEERRVGKECRL